MDVFLFSALKPCEEQVADLYLSGLRASVAKNDVEFVIRAHIPVKGQLGCQGFQISLDRFGGRACRPGGTLATGTPRAANADRKSVGEGKGVPVSVDLGGSRI